MNTGNGSNLIKLGGCGFESRSGSKSNNMELNILDVGDNVNILQGNFIVNCEVVSINGNYLDGFKIEVKQVLPDGKIRD